MQTMKRDNWLQELHTVVSTYDARSLRYGTQDCFQFVAHVVHAMTGTDYRDRFPAYRGRRAAMRPTQAARRRMRLDIERTW